MSTRSRIGLLLEGGFVRSVYCHSDGSPSGVGAILAEHYRDAARLKIVLDLGNLSALGAKIEPDPSRPHGFNYADRQPDCCCFYVRDRGDTEDMSADVTAGAETFRHEGEGYSYLLTPSGWLVSDGGARFKPLPGGASIAATPELTRVAAPGKVGGQQEFFFGLDA